MMKAAIIDDDLRDLEILERFLKKYCAEDVSVVAKANTVDKACLLLLETKPDVVFLDVELGDQTGFDLLSRFTEFPFKVIFVTAYDRYALQAIKFNALDYVLKPVDITELVNAVQKLKNSAKVSVDTELKNLLYTLAHPHHKTNRIAIPVSNGYKMAAVEDIIYCEASKEYTNLHLVNQPVICSSINLGEYEDLLSDYFFCRVHHSYLVNRDFVKQYVRGEGGELLLNMDNVIPVSRRRKQEVMEWLRIGKDK